MKKKIIVRIIVLVVVAVVLWVVDSAITEVPPRALTKSRIRVTQSRLVDYYVRHRKMPAKLSDLPDLPKSDSRDDKTEDEWSRPIKYSVQDGKVTLESLGADGQPGGDGLGEDIILIFDPEDSPFLEEFTSKR